MNKVVLVFVGKPKDLMTYLQELIDTEKYDQHEKHAWLTEQAE